MSSNCLAVYPKHNLLREQKISQYTQVVIEAQSYVWRDEDERLYWRKRAEKMLREHMRGNKSVLVEAALRAHSGTKNTRLVETRLLSEGFFSKIADGLGKATVAVMKRMPGYKTSRMRNWWIFGGGGASEDKRYREAYEQAQQLQMTENARAAIGRYFTQFEEEIRGLGIRFPNIKSGEAFENAIDLVVKAALAVRIYAGDTKVAADLKAAGITDMPKVDAGAYVITKEEGNQLIAGLRKRLMYWDRNLEQRYALAMEHVSYKVPTLAEAYGLNEADEDKKPTPDDLGKKGKETSTMEYLKSNVLPSFLAALGASGLALSWLAHQDWFISHFMEMVEEAVPTTYSWEDAPGPPSLERLPGLAGEAWSGGATQYFRNFMNLPFEPGENISNVKLLDMAHTFRAKGLVDIDGHPTERLLSLAVDRDAFQRDWMEHVVGNLDEKNMTLGEALPLSSAWGKAGGTLTLKVAGAMKAVWPKALKIIPGKGAVWALSSTGTALVAAAPWLAAAGAVLLVAGIGSKLMRRYGAKNSRASKISAALKMIDDINLPDQPPPPDPTPALPPSSTEEALKDPENIERVKEACANFDDPRLTKVLELLEAIAAGKVVREPPPSQQPLVNIIINGTVNGNVTVEYITKAIEGTLKNEPRVRPDARDIVSKLTGEAQAEESNDERQDSSLSKGEKLFAQLVFYKILKDSNYNPEVDYGHRKVRGSKLKRTLYNQTDLRKFKDLIKRATSEENLKVLMETYLPRGRLTLVEAIYGSSRLLEETDSTGSDALKTTNTGAKKTLSVIFSKKDDEAYTTSLFKSAVDNFKDSFTGRNVEKLKSLNLDSKIAEIKGAISTLPDFKDSPPPSDADPASASSVGRGESEAGEGSPVDGSGEITADQYSKVGPMYEALQKFLIASKKKGDTVLKDAVKFVNDQLGGPHCPLLARLLYEAITSGLIEEGVMSKMLESLGVYDRSFSYEEVKSNYRPPTNLNIGDLVAHLVEAGEKFKEATKKLEDDSAEPHTGPPAPAGPPRREDGPRGPASPGPGGSSNSESTRRRDDVILERWAILAGINRTEARR